MKRVVADCGMARDSRLTGGCSLAENKISQWIVGWLTKSKNKVKYDEFPEALALVKKFHAAAVYFSYGPRLPDLHELIAQYNLDCASIRPQVDFWTLNPRTRTPHLSPHPAPNS